jgi:hypothetical protein
MGRGRLTTGYRASRFGHVPEHEVHMLHVELFFLGRVENRRMGHRFLQVQPGDALAHHRAAQPDRAQEEEIAGSRGRYAWPEALGIISVNRRKQRVLDRNPAAGPV